MKYKVLQITNNFEDYPEAKIDSDNNPDIVRRLDDEFSLVVMGEDGRWCWANEFFMMHDINEFTV